MTVQPRRWAGALAAVWTLGSCAIPPVPERPEWTQVLAGVHGEQLAPIEVPELDFGICAPLDRVIPMPGDQVVYVLDLQTETRVARWLLSITCEERTEDDEEGVLPMRIELFDEKGAEVASRRQQVLSAPLTLGLFPAANGLQAPVKCLRDNATHCRCTRVPCSQQGGQLPRAQ